MGVFLYDSSKVAACLLFSPLFPSPGSLCMPAENDAQINIWRHVEQEECYCLGRGWPFKYANDRKQERSIAVKSLWVHGGWVRVCKCPKCSSKSMSRLSWKTFEPVGLPFWWPLMPNGLFITVHPYFPCPPCLCHSILQPTHHLHHSYFTLID